MIRKAIRAFAEQKVPKLNQSIPKGSFQPNLKLFLGFSVAGIVFKVIIPEIRGKLSMDQIRDYEPKAKVFEGVRRENVYKEISEKASKKPLLVYGSKESGVSSTLKGFCSENKHCLVLDTNGKWQEKLNEIGIPLRFSFYDYRLVLTLIGLLGDKFSDLVFILDGLENLRFNEKKYLTRLIRAKGHLGRRFIIASSDSEMIKEFSSVIDSDVYYLPDLSKAELHKILEKEKKYSYDELEKAYEQFGLDFALDYMRSDLTFSEYLTEKKSLVKKQAAEILENSEKKLKIINAVLSRSNHTPLGSIYRESSVIKDLLQRGLITGLNIDCYRFRNKLVLDSILEAIHDTTSNNLRSSSG